jgi:hypothetical protein
MQLVLVCRTNTQQSGKFTLTFNYFNHLYGGSKELAIKIVIEI